MSEIDGCRVVCSVVKKQGVIRNTKNRSHQNKHDLKLEERSKDPTKLKARKSTSLDSNHITTTLSVLAYVMCKYSKVYAAMGICIYIKVCILKMNEL